MTSPVTLAERSGNEKGPIDGSVLHFASHLAACAAGLGTLRTLSGLQVVGLHRAVSLHPLDERVFSYVRGTIAGSASRLCVMHIGPTRARAATDMWSRSADAGPELE